MSRWAWSYGLVVLGLAFGVTRSLHAQSMFANTDPLAGKALAKDLRAATKHQPRELRQELHDTARAEVRYRIQRVRGGIELADSALESLLRLVSADLALAGADQPARLAARERYWANLREIEVLTAERVLFGIRNFTAADYLAVQGERLLAERELMEALGGAGNPLPGAILSDRDDLDPLATRATAHDLRSASRQTPRALAQTALDTCWNEYAIRLQRIAGGQETPDVLFGAMTRRVVAARALGGDPADLIPVLESYWQMAAVLEILTAERVLAGVRRFTSSDAYAARDHRLEAEVWLVEARNQPGKLLPLQGTMQDPFGADDDPLDRLRLKLKRNYANLKFQAARSNPRQLHEQRREAILAEFSVRLLRVWGGQEVPDESQNASRRLLAAELALAGPAERVATLEHYFARQWELEVLTWERVEAGIKSFTLADYYQTRYARLQAEMLLAEARAEKK